jgi:hypothetical protein
MEDMGLLLRRVRLLRGALAENLNAEDAEVSQRTQRIQKKK